MTTDPQSHVPFSAGSGAVAVPPVPRSTIGGPGSPPPPPGTDAGGDEASLGRSVGGGMAWTIFGTFGGKFATLVAQVLLGWWLRPEDFGLFATAAGLTGVVMLLRDGGAYNLLIQRGPAEYRSLSGPLFWLALTLNILSAGIMIALAFPLAFYVYRDTALIPLLITTAISVPLMTPATILNARIRMDLRFKTLAQIQIISAIVRQASMVLLAKLGFGAMSFAIPFVVVSVFDSVAAYIVTRDKPWARAAEIRRWPSLFRQAIWVIVSVLANLSLDMGPYVVMAPALAMGVAKATAKETVGYFYFGFQITAQTSVFLAVAVQNVLFPVLQRLNDNADRQRDAVLRSLRALMLLATITCLGLAVTMDPLELIAWGGKWQPAVQAIAILGIFYAWRITFGLTNALLQAQGRFKRLSLLTAIEGLGLTLATAIACIAYGTVESIAWASGGWLMFIRLVVTAHVLAQFGVGTLGTFRALIPSWTLGLFAAAITWLLDQAVAPAAALVKAVAALNHAPTWAPVAAQIVRFFILGITIVVVFSLLTRFILKGQLRDTIAVLPGRIRDPISRILRLPVE